MSKIIITYGTYDLFHIGHLQLLKRARLLGSRLVVGVSSDKFNAIKNKKSIFPEAHRVEIVRALCCVDEVFLEESWEQKVSDIKRFDADILVMGSDWDGKFDYLKEHCDVVYLPRTDGISTTDIRELIERQEKTISEFQCVISVDIDGR